MLCNLAVDAMAELEDEHPGRFTWTLIDVSTREGVKRLQELRPAAGRQIPVPGVLVDGQIIFENIPEMEEFNAWLMEQAEAQGTS
ncbi:MAG: hypothetical protein Kow00129_08340 [Thermoleophilia bacterium]